MKTITLLAALTLSTLALNAQDAQKPERRGGNPIIAALDANHDGEIDASEISNAPAALRKLDKNGDGKLTRQELRPGGGGAGDESAKGDKAAKKAKKKAEKSN
jgi:hypothetical protein